MTDVEFDSSDFEDEFYSPQNLTDDEVQHVDQGLSAPLRLEEQMEPVPLPEEEMDLPPPLQEAPAPAPLHEEVFFAA